MKCAIKICHDVTNGFLRLTILLRFFFYKGAFILLHPILTQLCIVNDIHGLLEKDKDAKLLKHAVIRET